ncbi:MAG TPA: PH domain-containing protein [Thermoanaerobaculia bacterium]|jgi:uncharacterized membrane protein YdbT with pleckstrin-like domain
MNWRGFVLRVLKVPAEPQPPPGNAPLVFRAAPSFFTLRMIVFFGGQFVALLGILFAFFGLMRLVADAPRWLATLFRVGETIAMTLYVPQLIFGWAVARLDYELRWYLVSDRAIRIREGITSVREKTIALANIQNIAVKQGPLQRLLGIADVEVKTAGGGESSHGGKGQPAGESMHVGYFRGVADAEQIRDILREGVRRQRDTGLGDPDEDHHPPGDLEDALRELLAAARALRGAV